MGRARPKLLVASAAAAAAAAAAALAAGTGDGAFAGLSAARQPQVRVLARSGLHSLSPQHGARELEGGGEGGGFLEQLDLRQGHGTRGLRHSSRGASRRNALLPLVGASLFGCLCAGCLAARRAEALASLAPPAAEQLQRFDVPRDKTLDAGFAQGMAYGMVDYERAVSKRKRKLFERLLPGLPKDGAVVVEIGMGSFPNALYVGSKNAPTGMDIIGVDPNDSMEAYAREKAERAGVLKPEKGNTVRVVHGVAEALPLNSGVADAVVCTLTLCSVLEPSQAVAEIRRVLKPGGQFLFHEHVLSETNPIFAELQRQATPGQVKRADGCHLDRRTLETIRGAGFSAVDGEYFELDGFNYLNPTVAGIATA